MVSKMSRFSFEEAENYGAQKSNYFNLKDDGDTGKIRILINTLDDLKGVAIHEIQVGDKKIDVECLRSYNEPLEKCPFCEAGIKQNAKLFIPIYDLASKESKIWTRGKKFFGKISSLCSRYKPLVSMPFEVERIGKKGDTSTDYQFYPLEKDNAQITDFEEINAEGICFQVKTAEEMQYYLENGMFPEEIQARNMQNQQRSIQRQVNREMPVRRRPVNYGSEEDSF